MVGLSTAALALVLTSALAHATWNLLAKRVEGGVAFTWLFLTLSIPIYAPLGIAALVIGGTSWGALGFVFVAGSAALHVAYFVALARGYRAGDLSLVYPLARGSGPLLATVGAIALLGERPTPLALAGGALVVTGVLLLAGDPRARRREGALRAVAWALLTGVTIAAYTVWDRYAVAALLIAPLFYDWAANLGRSLLLLPFALRHWDEVRDGWRSHRREAIGIAALSPFAYILVLTALAISPVSYVAPAREIGILFGTVLGARVLAEGQPRRRVVAAAAMVCGVIGLAVG